MIKEVVTTPPIKSVIKRYSYLLLVLAVVCYLVSKIPLDIFVLDLLDHFQLYYFITFTCLACIGFCYLDDYALVAASLACLVIFIPLTFAPLYSHIATNHSSNGKTIKIVSSNLNAWNEHYEKITDFIQQQNPDILSLLELTPIQKTAIEKSIGNPYPYQYTRPIDNPTGIGVYAKFPITNANFYDPAMDGFGFISATIEIEHKKFNLLVVHPFPPLFQDAMMRRNTVINTLKGSLNDPLADTIVLGDFNNTMWSRDFNYLLSSLHVRVNLFAPATWPAVPLFPKIGIDNILLPDSLSYATIERGPYIGSDHFPIIANINL